MNVRRSLETAKHLLAPLSANCKEFYARWEQAANAPAGSMAGRWEGEWVSSRTGHRGSLRAVIETPSDERWRAWFRGGYARVFRACYGSELHVARLPDQSYTFSGKSDLGWAAGGTYEVDGQGTADELVFRYRSRLDQGEFRLRRASGAA